LDAYNANDLKIKPVLDNMFIPASAEHRNFIDMAEKSGKGVPLVIALERGDGLVSTWETRVFREGSGYDDLNIRMAERLVKSLVWLRGGWKLYIGGPGNIGRYIASAYAPGGARAFDAEFMAKVYGKPFTVVACGPGEVPGPNESSKPLGRHFNGCRIGLDLGGSDRKVSAVIDGEAIFSEEKVWHPKTVDDPDYHYREIMDALKTAASKMPRVDAIGVSAAGIYINNRVKVASLFIKVPEDKFKKRVADMFLNIKKEMGNIPLEVVNDGEVTALAGSINLEKNKILGIAMGTSEAGGYINSAGNITGWLNELAFVPVDMNPQSALDEWSGDYGCGVKYFSQDAVIKLAPAAGIDLDETLTPAEKLKYVQDLLAGGAERAAQVFRSIGCYLGYAIPYYSIFYDIEHVLLLGRVTSGHGGSLILEEANNVMKTVFPEEYEKISIHMPDESSRRVGQSVAAASLPEI
jgi:predicted NBD/HSP70 family sugar kinase